MACRMPRRGEVGLTIVEVLAASGISAVILAALAGVTFQVVAATGGGQDRLATLHDHRNAFSWISRDARMAVADQSTVLPASVTLRWTDPLDGSSYVSNYAQSGSALVRTLTVDSAMTTQTVARRLADSGFVASLNGELLTVTLSSEAGSTSQVRTERILMRPPRALATPTWIPTPAPCALSISGGPNYSGNGRRVWFEITNNAPGGTVTLGAVDVTWDSAYEELQRLRWDGSQIWSGSLPPPSAALTSLSGTLGAGERKELEFRFRRNGNQGTVQFSATFSGGCSVGN